MRSPARSTLAGLFGTVVSLMAGSGCSDCETKCAGASAEISVRTDVAAVEVCDHALPCVRQEFGASADSVRTRSFTMAYSGTGSSVTLVMRAFAPDGTELAAGEVTGKLTDGSCGCAGPARFVVGADGVSAVTND